MRKVRAKILRKLAAKIIKGQSEQVTIGIYRRLKRRWTRTAWNLRGKVEAT